MFMVSNSEDYFQLELNISLAMKISVSGQDGDRLVQDMRKSSPLVKSLELRYLPQGWHPMGAFNLNRPKQNIKWVAQKRAPTKQNKYKKMK